MGTTPTRRPNILLLIADDIGIDVATDLYPGLLDDLYGLYSARGHARASAIHGRPAPLPVALERIAQHGMVFSNLWAQPVCSPTRAAIITGLFAAKTGVTTPGSPMSANHTTFVELLKNDADYRTALVGKWHLGTNTSGVLPQEVGFDVFKGSSGGALEDFWSYSGARNGRYKVVCIGGTSSCGFYDLVADPLEEYPLAKPSSCTAFRSTWSTADPQWHYCRLMEVVQSESIF